MTIICAAFAALFAFMILAPDHVAMTDRTAQLTLTRHHPGGTR